MNKSTAHILKFSDIRKADLPYVGGKGANLGEMFAAGIPVPDGFVVTAKAYFDFLDTTSLRQKILTELSGLNTDDSNALSQASKNIKTAILAAKMPDSLKEEIRKAYHHLSGDHNALVAVRSSATAEDLPDASFAGQQETYLNIEGTEDVVEHVQKCWASLFEARAIFYRTENGFDHLKVGIAVPVQLMVQSEVSGIMFTVNPLTNNRDEVSVEAAFGLGQPIVSGEVTPDQFIVDKESGEIKSKHLSLQKWQLTQAGKTPIAKAHQKVQKLDDSHVKELAQLGVKIEDHYGRPQDIEWAMEGGELLIVQSRPVTTLKRKKEEEVTVVNPDEAAKFILEGLGASPGVASGPVKVIKDASEISKVKKGDVLVAVMTNPDFVPAMRRACAILTDEGGRTSHAAIVSRELGIPAIVGSQQATSMLSPGEVITVDGSNGKVYSDDVTKVEKVEVEDIDYESLKTATKIYMNLAEPDLAAEMAEKNVDGVGLLRAEFMIAQIGKHPRKFIKEGKQQEFIDALTEGLTRFAEAFDPRPVVYRFTDFRTNEYANLEGGQEFEKDEPNPMIGFRGVSRYIEDDDVFELELEAIKKVRNKLGHKNLHVMYPFVRTVDQLKEVKKITAASGLQRGPSFKVWMMVEIPSNVILLDDFIDVGIDGVSVGTNDLTMLTLGVDRDNERVANVYSEMNPAVLQSLEKIVKTCRKRKVTCSICGQAPSVYPELVKMLADWGITSISVSPDVLNKTRKIVYDAEHEVLKKAGKK
ncbi:phosphoenolpyruvate synthase [candidate division WWE3 bacterium]|nr:phosphoenolpyruvate synthase [candidate division WWE3 bacterium]